jgi:hypothetical protein
MKEVVCIGYYIMRDLNTVGLKCKYVENNKYINNFDGKTSQHVATWKAMKDMGR